MLPGSRELAEVDTKPVEGVEGGATRAGEDLRKLAGLGATPEV